MNIGPTSPLPLNTDATPRFPADGALPPGLQGMFGMAINAMAPPAMQGQGNAPASPLVPGQLGQLAQLMQGMGAGPSPLDRPLGGPAPGGTMQGFLLPLPGSLPQPSMLPGTQAGAPALAPPLPPKAGTVDPANSNGQSTQTDGDANAAQKDERYAALDAAANPVDTSKWSNLAGGDPQQGKELNRPMEVVSVLTNPNAPPEQKQAAHQFIEDNPSFKAALTNAGALDKDGGVHLDKAGDLLDDMKAHLSDADSKLSDFKKNNPGADKNATDATASLCLVKANMSILSNATEDTAGKRVGSYHSFELNKDDLTKIGSDPGMSSALTNAAKVWSTSGAFSDIDRSGVDKATNGEDGMADEGNLDNFIQKEAPKTADDYAKFSGDAALQNVTGNTSTDGLNADVLKNPDKYSPQQLGAVMVQLMKTLASVQAGGDSGDKLKDTSKTEKALQDSIQKLAGNPKLQDYLKQSMPPRCLPSGRTSPARRAISWTRAAPARPVTPPPAPPAAPRATIRPPPPRTGRRRPRMGWTSASKSSEVSAGSPPASALGQRTAPQPPQPPQPREPPRAAPQPVPKSAPRSVLKPGSWLAASRVPARHWG